MTRCPSCGGVLGVDCFNPGDCAMITASMQRDMDMQYMQQHGDVPPDLSSELAKAERDLHECQGHIEHLESEVQRLLLYERACNSMAVQIICPKMTGEELARKQLGE